MNDRKPGEADAAGDIKHSSSNQKIIFSFDGLDAIVRAYMKAKSDALISKNPEPNSINRA